MKAALISMGSVSSEWSLKAMQKYFDEVDNLDVRNIEVDISDKPIILHNGKPIEHYDCVYAKGSFKFAMILRAITDVLKSSDKEIFLPYISDSYTNGHDKILSHLKLLHNKVPTPVTYIASSPESGKGILQKMNYPIIMKLPSGTQGKGVMYADSFESASSMLDTLTTLRQPFLIQEYIETGSTDLRVIIIGDKVVAAMKRVGRKDDKRANIHAGGLGEPVIISEDVKRISLKAARALGCDICAVDILDSKHKGPLVIELNLSPGLQGISKATGIDVADKISSYLADETRKMLDKGKKKDSKDVMGYIDAENNNEVCIITNLNVRGSKLILPEIAYKISKINEDTEVELCLQKGKITIKKASE